jgi:hypothetical protein
MARKGVREIVFGIVFLLVGIGLEGLIVVCASLPGCNPNSGGPPGIDGTALAALCTVLGLASLAYGLYVVNRKP